MCISRALHVFMCLVAVWVNGCVSDAGDFGLAEVSQRRSPPAARREMAHSVSLRALQTELAAAPARTDRLATLGGLATIRGYEWDATRQDLTIFGTTTVDPAEHIPLLAFIDALRTDSSRPLTLSLEDNGKGRYVVELSPELRRANTLSSIALRADLLLKAMDLGLVAAPFDAIQTALQRLQRQCRDGTYAGGPNGAAALADRPMNTYFAPGLTRLSYAATPTGFRVLIELMEVRLATGDPGSSDADNLLASDMDSLREYRAFLLLFESVYGVALVAQLIRKEAIALDWQFWESYPLQAKEFPRELSWLEPRKVQYVCREPPYHRVGLRLSTRLRGGVTVGGWSSMVTRVTAPD